MIHIIRTRKFKSAAAVVLIRQPLTREFATYSPVICDILAHASAKYPGIRQMRTAAEDLYGAAMNVQVVQRGEQQILEFYFESLTRDGNFKRGMEFLREIIENPLVVGNGFNRDFFESAVSHIRNDIEGRINNKAEYAERRLIEEMCKGEPFGVSADGYLEDLDKLTSPGLLGYYKKALDTFPRDICAIGDVDESDINIFASPKREIVIPPASISYKPKQPTYFTEDFNTAQGKLCMGFRSKANPVGKDFYGLWLFNSLLGGGPNSILFKRVRERESLCYYINSVNYRAKSLVVIRCGVSAENFERVTNIVLEEVAAIARGAFSPLDFQNAQSEIIKRLRAGEDYPNTLLNYYVSQYLINDKDTLTDAIAAISALTPVDAIEAAAKVYLDTVYMLK
ncbi:MAG: insulinase family protein [Clostridiales bacterium]|nr:insulinase family protein [Clostridiales bacterium]